MTRKQSSVARTTAMRWRNKDLLARVEAPCLFFASSRGSLGVSLTILHESSTFGKYRFHVALPHPRGSVSLEPSNSSKVTLHGVCEGGPRACFSCAKKAATTKPLARKLAGWRKVSARRRQLGCTHYFYSESVVCVLQSHIRTCLHLSFQVYVVRTASVALACYSEPIC